MNKKYLKIFYSFIFYFFSSNILAQSGKFRFETDSDDYYPSNGFPWITAIILLIWAAIYLYTKYFDKDNRDNVNEPIFWSQEEKRKHEEYIREYNESIKSEPENNVETKTKKGEKALDRKIYEITTISRRNKDSNKVKSTIQKTKIISCMKCNQRLKLTIENELEITCPTCKYKWIGVFKFNQ